MKKYEIILSALGLIVASAALYQSCTANEIAVSNQKKLERLECYDKVSAAGKELIDPYRGALITASRIHKYLLTRGNIAPVHTEYQMYASRVLVETRRLDEISKRFGNMCVGDAARILDEVRLIGEMMKGTDTFEQFGGFNSRTQDQHQANLNWLIENNIASFCCGS